MKVTNHTDLFGRRDFLRIGSLGALGVSLDGVLRANGNKDISCILIWQSGGCGQQDTFDMKPDAPSEYRGEFKPISSNIPGIHVCEHLPYTAKQVDKFTILRSMRSKEKNHERAINYLLTGHLPLSTMEFPSIGSVISKELGPKKGMPPYVTVPNTFPSYGAGYLGGDHNPFIAGDPNVSDYQARDLSLPSDVDWSRLGDRRWLLKQMDAKFEAIESSPDFAAMDSFYKRAYSLLSSPAAKNAFNIHQEPEPLRRRYGRTPVGQGCLLARRLVESGVRFVTVAKGWLNYDTHGDNFNRMKKALLPEFDRGFSALLEDLDQRGMLDTTLVIAMGEFGRTPKINAGAGRDHHSDAWSIAIAGAGIPGGRVMGATDKHADKITDFPVEPEALLYTIYQTLGINPRHEYQTFLGRPKKILDTGGVIPGLLA